MTETNTKIDEKEIKDEVLNQVKDGIDSMVGKFYKLNMVDSFTPSWYQMRELAVLFNLSDADFNFSMTHDGEYQPADEVEETLSDTWEEPNTLPFKPTEKDIKHDKNAYNHVKNNYSDEEMLDTYNFDIPHPLTKKDIMGLFHEFKNALFKAKITPIMIKQYIAEDKGMSVINWGM